MKPLCGLAFVVCLATSCAGARTAGVPVQAQATELGWQHLIAGDDDAALAAFAKAPSDDPRAAFARGSVAFERGDAAASFDAFARVLERAGDAPPGLASAAASRAAVVALELPVRGPAADRLAALVRVPLPWPARVALEGAHDGMARRRGDPQALDAAAAATACVRTSSVVNVPGALPNLDLEANVPAGARAVISKASGCRLSVPAFDGRPGVRALRSRVDVPVAGTYDVVLDYFGLAALRVDGGRWRRHGSQDVYGPRTQAARLELTAGAHDIDVNVGSYGGTTELRLFVVPAVGPEDLAPPATDPERALVALLVNDEVGAIDGALQAADVLTHQRRFAVGIAAAASFLSRDPTRPAALAQDGARALFAAASARDPRFARALRELASIELERERFNEAVDHAERAVAEAPSHWPAALVLIDAYRARGLERDADRVLDAAVALARKTPGSACPVLIQGARRAQQRDEIPTVEALSRAVAACDATADLPIERLRAAGDLAAAARAQRAQLAVSADPAWTRGELAETLLAAGQTQAALAELRALIERAPRDPALRLRLADVRRAAGDAAGARAVLEEAVRTFPSRLEVRLAARAVGLPSPLDAFRVDGARVIKDFMASGRRYDAPAVLVLDRAVMRAFDDGSQAVLTHNIVRVQSKDGIERWGEITIPDGAEVLTLRTHKPDGRVREPEEIAGKPTVSAPDLLAGDFVEWETLEWRDANETFAPGFIGERFYFQSLEAPLDLSELLVVAPEGRSIAFDRRAGAPKAESLSAPPGTRVVRFAAHQQPQLFSERSAVSAIEWIPSVRSSSGASMQRWGRHLADQLYGIGRGAPALREAARAIASRAGTNPDARAAALVRWVTDTIELEDNLLEPATATLARGRGNRAALMVALGRALGLDVDLALVRSAITAAPESPVAVEELDDFADLLVRFQTSTGPRYVDPRLRRTPFGYIPATLLGATAFVIGRGKIERTSSTVADARRVTLDMRLDEDGAASGRVTETLTGWPAVEWAELLDRLGDDEVKLRQDFEQRWLNQHFAGAQLGTLAIDVLEGGSKGVRVNYTFTRPQMALGSGGELKLVPSFFRSQPGRRFATERERRTTLLMGADIGLELDASITLPKGARVVDLGTSAVVTTGHLDGLRFEERRSVTPSTDKPAATSAAEPRVVLHRSARLPFLRVPPSDYGRAARALRRVDPIEQAEIRFALPGRPTAVQTEPAPAPTR